MEYTEISKAFFTPHRVGHCCPNIVAKITVALTVTIGTTVTVGTIIIGITIGVALKLVPILTQY